MRPWFATRPTRAVEATPAQLVSTGAMAGPYGRDPIDGDVGYRRAGRINREVPYWTRERARDYAVAAYRSNPMCTAVVDTYVAFAVGDSGVSPMCTNDQVREVVDEFWDDPRNNLGGIQEVSLRSQILMGEKLYELMVGRRSGVVRFSPVDPISIKDVTALAGNPLWPDRVILPALAIDAGATIAEVDSDRKLKVAQVNDRTGLLEGECTFWAPWRTLDTDMRGMPMITTILDWLDNYDTVLSNLIDRTALARYLVWTVKVAGGPDAVDAFIAKRGGVHIPPSGSVEVHTDSVEWNAQTAQSGAFEDIKANSAVLTQIAGGAGLAKTWLAEPEDSNRATSMTMAEPVRRRVGAVQKIWLCQQTELVRFAVDQAVRAKRLPRTVEVQDPRTGAKTEMPAAKAVIVTGPEVSVADAQFTAQVLLNLSTGLEKFVQIGALSKEAARLAARKAWEDYVGVPYRAELDKPEANADDVATHVDDSMGDEKTLAQLRKRLASAPAAAA